MPVVSPADPAPVPPILIASSIPLLASTDSSLRQHLYTHDEIWEDDTDDFLDSLKILPGMRVLEYGCGFGFDLARLARRVGPQGEVIGVEPTPALLEEARGYLKKSGLKSARVVLGDQAIDPVPEGPYDLIFCSWKPGNTQPAPRHVPQLRQMLNQFRTWLAPSAQVAFWEHHYEGIRLIPELKTLPAILDLVSARNGGIRAADWLPGELLASGFLFERAFPRQKAEPPGSPLFRWVEESLRQEGQSLVEQDRLPEEDWLNFLKDWEGRRIDPKALLFSPQALGLVARPIDPAVGDIVSHSSSSR